jgi:ribosomal protein L35AE/L33A
MFTLSIEHAVSDFPTWKQAFDRFDQAREKGGVLSYRVRRPVDDPHYLVIELDFDARENADTFLQLLHDVVWANRDASPALVGTPQTRILEAC